MRAARPYAVLYDEKAVLNTTAVSPSDLLRAFPHHLAGVVLAAARDVEGSLAEIRRSAPERWPWGLIVYARVGVPPDNPELEPVDTFRCDRGRYNTQVSPGTPPPGCRDGGERLKLRLMRIKSVW